MSRNFKRHAARLLPVVIGAGLIGAGAIHTDVNAAGPLRCEIEVMKRGGAVDLEAVVHAGRAAHGTYALEISGGGWGSSSTISQSGDFSAAPGTRSSIGSVTLASDGGTYTARLAVTSGNTTQRCVKRVRL